MPARAHAKLAMIEAIQGKHQPLARWRAEEIIEDLVEILIADLWNRPHLSDGVVTQIQSRLLGIAKTKVSKHGQNKTNTHY